MAEVSRRSSTPTLAFHSSSRRTSQAARLGPAQPLFPTPHPCHLSGVTPPISDLGDEWLCPVGATVIPAHFDWKPGAQTAPREEKEDSHSRVPPLSPFEWEGGLHGCCAAFRDHPENATDEEKSPRGASSSVSFDC